MKYYLLDENKNLVEGFDKEGFLALLQEAIDQGSLENIDPDSAVASKLRSLLNGTTHHIEFVTQAQYNQLVADEELVPNTWYFITDDETAEDMLESLNELSTNLSQLNEGLLNGSIKPKISKTLTGTFEEIANLNQDGTISIKEDISGTYAIFIRHYSHLFNFGVMTFNNSHSFFQTTPFVFGGMNKAYFIEDVSPNKLQLKEYDLVNNNIEIVSFKGKKLYGVKIGATSFTIEED